jgi:hypothetical protein
MIRNSRKGPSQRGGRDITLDDMTQPKFVAEQRSDGFIAYPLGLRGAVVGDGDKLDEALADARSAAKFHVETFGAEAFQTDSPLRDAFTNA